ncbi:RNA polymerase sigma factor [Frondihabitans australicus]|uniref:RNA polymerase sigma factor n=1 Tax=Frondihabitans australicus TaxID=386892 RepID=UPI000EAFC1EA|nr:RNA polymerase sigma factor [Frondihabitans australicus]
MPDEITIWERAREGDDSSFATLFREHRDRIYGQALRLTRSSHDAEDVTALVFLEAWRRRSNVRLVDGSILAWLLVCTNLVSRNVDRSRRRHRIAMSKLSPQEHADDHSDEVLTRWDSTGRESALRAAFLRLSPNDRDVLTLCVVYEYSLADAATALDVPVGTVKSRLSRAKKRLADLTLAAGTDLGLDLSSTSPDSDTGASASTLGGTR